MLYIETDKTFSRSFADELEAFDLPKTWHVTTRRKIGGKVESGFPRAVAIDAPPERYEDFAEAVEGHTPFFGHVNRKIAHTKAEANRRILERLPDWKQRNYIAFSKEVTDKANGIPGLQDPEPLTPQEIAAYNFMKGEWAWAKSVREASNQIEENLSNLSDELAAQFDVTADHLWPPMSQE